MINSFMPLAIAVLVISDTRTEADDRSGAFLTERIKTAGHNFIEKIIVPDDKNDITAQTKKFCESPNVDVVLATGGTGLTARDVSYETFSALYEKEITGFGFAFHRVSESSVGLASVLSRASAGLVQGKLVFSLPGSTGACRDGWDGVIAPLLDGAHKPCNLAQLMARFN